MTLKEYEELQELMYKQIDLLIHMSQLNCTGFNPGYTCIETGSSDTGPMCPRCLAKELLQGVCKRLHVVPEQDFVRLRTQLSQIQEAAGRSVESAKILPHWAGWA
jgi:hypothetical protein